MTWSPGSVVTSSSWRRAFRAALQELGERVRTALAFRVPWGDTAVEVQASVGVALSDDHSGGDLVAMADKAMYGVKRSPLRPIAVEPSLTWCR